MLKITMIIVMTFFTIILTPHERASANPLAVGGALYLGGAGVYVLGAVGVAAIVGIAGCTSCEEDINEHAARTWDGTTQLAKDGMQAMVDASVSAGNSIQQFNTDFINYMNTEGTLNLANEINSLQGMKNFKAGGSTGGAPGAYYAIGQTINLPINNYFVVNGTQYTSLSILLTSANEFILKAGTATLGYKAVSEVTRKSLANQFMANPYEGNLITMANMLGVSAFMLASGVSNALVDTYQSGVSATREAWQDMQDAGLVLPTDSARLVNQYGPVTYDPATDSYAGIDGVNVARGDISVEYQKPHWKTLEDLALAGLSGAGAGLYIDGWAGSDSITSTYDPVTDMTTTTTTTSGTTATNVTTGETVTSTSATTTSTTSAGDTTGSNTKTPEGETPKTQTGKANRWGKLVTTKFPFSLPWDLFFVLSFLNADPKTPVFSIDERINKRENVEGIQIKFDIDLSFLDPYVPWFRRFLVLGFALFLILNTRKLLGGAQ